MIIYDNKDILYTLDKSFGFKQKPDEIYFVRWIGSLKYFCKAADLKHLPGSFYYVTTSPTDWT